MTTEQIKSETIKKFTGSLKFSDFKVKTLTADDFSVSTDYEDSDGDIAKTSGAFIVGATEYEWTDAKGVMIANTTDPTNLSKALGCGSGYSFPLSLKIQADVVVHSEYGDPSKSEAKKLTKVYQIVDTNAVCFAKPNQMIITLTRTWYGVNSSGVGTSWNDTANTARNVVNGGGYDSNVFDPVNGFKASASPTFPTTGFPGAQFQLVMTGAQDDWTYSVPTHSAEVVSVDATGNVLLKKKPSGEVIVRAKLNADNNVYNDYKFTPTTNGWFVPKSGTYTYANAKTQCANGETGLPTRADLTNSPRNTVVKDTNWSWIPNYFTRVIGKGVFNEWGWMAASHYPSSQWAVNNDNNMHYWTKEVHTTGSIQFVVHPAAGDVGYYPMSVDRNVACRE